MSPQDITDRLAAIYDQKAQALAELKQQVYNARTFPDGAVVSRTRHDDDGTLYDYITGTVVGADVFEVDDTINIQYWVRVDSPADYRSHQQCSKYNLPMHKAEDFWQGDQRWKPVS